MIDALVDAARATEPTRIEPVPDLAVELAWTGPRPDEVAPIPGDRWPYGPPSHHEAVCNLFPHLSSPGGLFCDCKASAADDVEYGEGQVVS